MKCAIVIPARLASTRLPQKLLHAQTGKPLICHTLDAAMGALATDPRVVTVRVAADDEAILRAVNDYAAANALSAEAVLTRIDHTSGSDRIAEAIETLPLEIDTVLNLQGDEPEMPTVLLSQVLDLLDGDAHADIATLVVPIRESADFANPHLVKCVMGENGRALYFSRSPIPHDRDSTAASADILGYGHLGLYAYRRESLVRFVGLPTGTLEATEKLEQLRALEHGMIIRVGIACANPPKGIDTLEDYAAFVQRCG